MSHGLDIGNAKGLVTPVFLQMDPLMALNLMAQLRHEHNIFCSAVTYPVVPPGVVQLRLVATACHDLSHVEPTVDAIVAVYKELVPGAELGTSPVHGSATLQSSAT